jgi:hypothetical protein
MTSKITRFRSLLNDMTDDETMTVAREALDVLGIAQIITLVLELDPVTKQDVLEALAGEGGAS